MRHFLWLILLLYAGRLSSQTAVADSFYAAVRNARTDSSRITSLFNLSTAYMATRPDSALMTAQQALFIARHIKSRDGEMKTLKQMASVYQMTGNYPQALRFYLERLRLDETDPDPLYKIVTTISIANLYQLEGDYKKALTYSLNGLKLIEENKADDYLWYSFSGLGDLYEKMNDLPNAMRYNLQAYKIAVAKKDSGLLGMSLNNTANAYAKAAQADTALAIYNSGLPYLEFSDNRSFLCESYQGIARILFQKGDIDSAVIYAEKSLFIAQQARFDKKYLTSVNLLTEIYRAAGKTDSAFLYQDKMVVMKDSLYSQDKIKQLSSLTIQEELRQKELVELQLRENEDRKYKMHMLMIGLLIPFFFLLSFLLSKRKIKVKVLEFIGILSLLLLFEYLTLLLHPWVVEVTHHSPFLEIVIFVIVAALLTPTHHRIQHWMLHKLTNHRHHPAPVLPPDSSQVLSGLAGEGFMVKDEEEEEQQQGIS